MTVVHATHHLEERYFERMLAGLGHKAELLPWVTGPNVLDIGAGGGDLAAGIAQLGHRVTALDATPDAIAHLASRPELHDVREGLADQAVDIFGEGSFDTVVASAIMHEVYSYGDSHGNSGWTAVDRTFDALRTVLRPGGRLLLRDGVMPPRPLGRATVSGLTTADIDAYELYMTLTPHHELCDLRRDGDTITGSRHAVAEFLFTLTWGIGTFHREALERYQLHTLAGYQRYAADRGFRTLHLDGTTQPGYREGLARLRVNCDGRDWFPQTNAIWVFELR